MTYAVMSETRLVANAMIRIFLRAQVMATGSMNLPLNLGRTHERRSKETVHDITVRRLDI